MNYCETLGLSPLKLGLENVNLAGRFIFGQQLMLFENTAEDISSMKM